MQPDDAKDGKRSPEALFIEQIRKIRQEKKLTQRDLSERLARLEVTLDPTAITRIEKGSRALKLDEAIAIATALDSSLESILRDAADASARLRWLRSRADDDMNKAWLNGWSFIHGIQQIRRMLADSPHLMHVPAEEYVPWVLRRLLPDDPDRRMHIYEPDAVLAEQLRELSRHLLDIIEVVVGEEPEYEDEGVDAVSEVSDGEHPQEA